MNKIQYRAGYKYQLAADYSTSVEIRPDGTVETDYIDLSEEGLLTIKRGYAWDGPSGPTIDTKTFMRGALVHDALYQLMRSGDLSTDCREAADQELYRICRKDGMNRFRAKYVLFGVRKGAGFAADPKAKKKVCCAPRG